MSELIEEFVEVKCYHCGNSCEHEEVSFDEKSFCCVGCKTVYEILQDNNLCSYYDLNENAGVSLKAKNFDGKYNYLSESEIEAQILNFKSDALCKVTLYIPAVHCTSCVWLLENFNRVREGVISSRLNFVKKELSLSYNPILVSLKDIVELLASLGYEPLINLETADKPEKSKREQHRLLLRIGVVGFAFGNIMLLSFPEYFKLDLQNKVDATYQKFFLYLNFLLALPVYFYGASDYLKGAYISLRENLKGTTNILSVDIPIFLGITALFIRSTYETLVNQTSGYWDSLAGLVLFLLVGRWVQQVTYDYLSFERDYKSYFPLAVKIKNKGYKNISDLIRGDEIEIKHQELIPADALLLSETAWVDYSFVTGESEPIEIHKGATVFAGGKQLGQEISLLVQKTVSQSYLTELWNNEAFKKEKISKTSEFANYFSKYFTYIAIALAALTGLYWYFNNPVLMWPTMTAVLMVACPCALTLAMPFTMNTAAAILGRKRFFVKNPNIIPLIAEIDVVAFDKTGTLTSGKQGGVNYVGDLLNNQQKSWIASLAHQSTHPLSRRIANHFDQVPRVIVHNFKEIPGFGIQGEVEGISVRLGSSEYLGVSSEGPRSSGQVMVEIGHKVMGVFSAKSVFRTGWQEVLKKLKSRVKVALLSGDNDNDKSELMPFFETMHFYQKPQDKLNFIRKTQEANHKVLMIGDGLNDAGALKQSNVGIAVTEDVNAFSPACDVIMDSDKFEHLADLLKFSKTSMKIVVASFILSMVYNVIGVGMAMMGILSPLKAAIFMPASSLSVVLFAVGLTYLFAKIRLKWE